MKYTANTNVRVQDERGQVVETCWLIDQCVRLLLVRETFSRWNIQPLGREATNLNQKLKFTTKT